MSHLQLVTKMGVPLQRVNTLINGRPDMTAEAILLSRVIKTSAEFWMNLQVSYELYEPQRAMDAGW
jgi:addiction module HigA family antidote